MATVETTTLDDLGNGYRTYSDPETGKFWSTPLREIPADYADLQIRGGHGDTGWTNVTN